MYFVHYHMNFCKLCCIYVFRTLCLGVGGGGGCWSAYQHILSQTFNCDDSSLLGCYAVSLAKWFSMFWITVVPFDSSATLLWEPQILQLSLFLGCVLAGHFLAEDSFIFRVSMVCSCSLSLKLFQAIYVT